MLPSNCQSIRASAICHFWSFILHDRWVGRHSELSSCYPDAVAIDLILLYYVAGTENELENLRGKVIFVAYFLGTKGLRGWRACNLSSFKQEACRKMPHIFTYTPPSEGVARSFQWGANLPNKAASDRD